MMRLVPVLLVLAYAAMLALWPPLPRPTLAGRLTLDAFVRHTPVRDQGALPTCWAYATISLIESDRLFIGDSVELSAQWLVRCLALERWGKAQSRVGLTDLRGTGFTALRLLRRYGALNYAAYPDTLYLPARPWLKALAAARTPAAAAQLADSALGPAPPMAHLYGMAYTPADLAASVLVPDSYEAFMSDARLPYGRPARLPGPDNREGARAVNLPLDALVDTLVATLRRGQSLAWQGDVSQPTYLARGVAYWPVARRLVNARERQLDLDAGLTTDDHMMHLIGLAHDARGRRFFLLKNSYGPRGPMRGYVLMDENYLRMKTIGLMRRRWAK